MIMRGRKRKPAAVNQVGSRWSLRLYQRRPRYLHEHLLAEILCRLPVKSLLRFRCVSKSWLALVDDADFAQLHLKTFKNNRDETRLAVYEEHDNVVLRYVRCADTLEPGGVGYGPGGNSGKGCRVESSLDGLVLLNFGDVSNAVLELHNYSLRLSFEIPPMDPDIGSQVIGLGFDLRAKDYKIVTVNAVSSNVGLYTIGADSWEIIPFQAEEGKNLVLDQYGGNVYLQGSLYFLTRDEHKSVFMSSIDLSENVISCSSMPDDIDNPFDRRLALFLVDDGSSVAIFDYDDISSFWVLERETMNWTKRLLWSERRTGELFSKKNGDMLICFHDHLYEVVSYNFEKKEYEILRKIQIARVYSYVESLIFYW